MMQTQSSAPTGEAAAATEAPMSSVMGGFRWGLDRMLSIGYGLVYDYIFGRFGPYQQMQREIVALARASAPDGIPLGKTRVLDIGCGPGNLAILLAEAGLSVVGVDAYDALVTLAQEKRRARRLPNVAFKRAALTEENPFRSGQFDLVVNLHFLYAHPEPQRVLEQACEVLKPGGHGIFVNLTRRVPVWATAVELSRTAGLRAAVSSLLWVLPNTIFETVRRRIGPHYWQEAEFSARLELAGFQVLDLRRTFLEGASLLAWVRKPAPTGKG